MENTEQKLEKQTYTVSANVYKITDPKTKTVAMASVSVASLLVINSVSVVDGKYGLFTNMPTANQPDSEGKYKPIVELSGEGVKSLTASMNKAVCSEYKEPTIKDKNATPELPAYEVGVQVNLLKDMSGTTKAMATIDVKLPELTVTINNATVREGENGLFVSMPSQKGKDGTYRDIAHSINKELTQAINKLTLTAYDTKLSYRQNNEKAAENQAKKNYDHQH